MGTEDRLISHSEIQSNFRPTAQSRQTQLKRRAECAAMARQAQ